MKRKVLIAFFLIFASLNALAQMGKLFDANQQLSSSFTSQVYLDRDGFIWTATRNGLNRYDGYQFRIYKKEKDQQTGMASNYVNCMMQDHNGLFYLGMWGALQTYDGMRFRDVKVKVVGGQEAQCYVLCFEERRDGSIWAGTSGHGLLKFDDSEHAHQVDGLYKDVHTIYHLLEDSRGHLWIVTRDKGLICDDGKKPRIYFKDSPVAAQLRKVCEDQHGNIYLGTSGAGLYVLRNNEFVKIESVGNKPISEIYCNSSGKLMIGYDGGGIGVYDPSNGMLTDNPYYSRAVDLSKCKVVSITEDRSGNYWIGLLQKGLYRQPGKSVGFNYMGYRLGNRNVMGEACVISTCIDSKKRVWIGTDKDGLYCFSDGLQLLKHYKENIPSTIMTIVEGSDGRIWVGSYGEGCGWIDPAGAAYHPFDIFPYLAPSSQRESPTISIFDMNVDGQGQIWMASMGQGVLCVNPQSAGSPVKQYIMNPDAPTDSTINTLTNNYISQISLSPDKKRVYVATTMGVCCLDIVKGSWTSVFGKNCLNYGTPTRIAREYAGKLWIGTNDGLYSYDLQKKQLQLYNTAKGLADNGIASIEQDKQGHLWISTDHGLCRLDPKTGVTQNYFIDNGLQSNEFSDGASWTSESGMMIFGGVGGITWFNPADIGQSKWTAAVSLTDFSIGGVSVNSLTRSDGYQVTDTTVIASQRFELGYHDNSFAIQLSTLTYDNPEHITYLYRINNEQWVRMQPGVNEITFSHMQPGNYDFCVVAEHNGIKTPERCFTVVIHAPWYRSTFAYIIYILLAALAVVTYLQYRHRKEQDRLRLQEHIHAEQMADAKLKFFMNISHEIRTPMTLITAPLLSLMKHDNDPQRRGAYETIRRNAERILGLINQMMDLRKIDKGQMQMRMRETDLISFVGDNYTLFAHQAEVKDVQFVYEHEMDRLPVWIDRGNFDKVIVNLLSNAFKFTPSGGMVKITISQQPATADQPSMACISIYDNGELIPEDKLERIFERFYQSPSTLNDRNVGTGIGLDLTRSLVELHHGTVKASNNPDGHGCEFVVTIPMGCDHLSPEEIDTTPSETEIAEQDPALSLEEPQEAPAETESTPVASKVIPSAHQRVVVVEDDEEIRNYLISELQKDFDVIGCADGREGLAEVLKSVPDLVISDVMMPQMDGNTLCSTIKSSPTTSHIPVVLLTAKNRDEDRLEGLETGADAYIVKPFNMDILRRTVINLISTHRMLQLKYGRNDQLEEQVESVQVKSPDDKLMERVMTVINKNLNNSDLSVDGIADEVGISRVHLHRKMKELTGQTPHDFIRNIRLKQAAHLLANNNMNITEVMYACGFNNAASFSTIFKKFYGLSPRDYMREHSK